MDDEEEISQWDPSRPLFTIAVLVVGVVGGLAIVITVVYFYRFCLKKRPPLTTTGKPDSKRDQMRSTTAAHSRPLPLPIHNTNPQPNLQQLSPLPEQNRAPPQLMVKKESMAYHDSLSNVNQGYPVVKVAEFPEKHPTRNLPYKQLSEHLEDGKGYLAVNPLPNRALSAELLVPRGEDNDPRRASFDAPKRRLLPSTEHLEAGLKDPSIPQIRRMSTLNRSNAVQSVNVPIKQNSSPLPLERPLLYDRGHSHSRSWNPEHDSYEPEFVDQHSIEDEQQPPFTYYQAGTYAEQFIPRISIAEPAPSANLGVRHIIRQAKSFDDRSERFQWQQKRSQSESEQKMAQKMWSQETMHPEDSSIARECQSLWAARDHLEQLRALGIEDQSSASTSFESNTEAISIPRQTAPSSSEQDANQKRNKYRSLLLQRKMLSTTGAVSSMDSTLSTESNGERDHPRDESIDSLELEHRRLSLMNNTSMDSSTAAKHPRLNTRDYSVDAASDSMFREFSRFDPKYETLDVPSPSIRPGRGIRNLQKFDTFDQTSLRRQPLISTRQMSYREDFHLT